MSGRPRPTETPDIPGPPIRQIKPSEKRREVARREDADASKRRKVKKVARARGDIPEPPVRRTAWVWDRTFISLMVAALAFVFLIAVTVAVIVKQIDQHVYLPIVMGVLALVIGIVNRRGRS